MRKWTNRYQQVLISALLFTGCALPGLFIFVASTAHFLAKLLDKQAPMLNPVISGLGMLVGMLLMLVGVGKWGRWYYLLVFLAIPAGLLITIPFGGKEAPALVIGILAYLIFYRVRNFYGDSGSREKEHKHNNNA